MLHYTQECMIHLWPHVNSKTGWLVCSKSNFYMWDCNKIHLTSMLLAKLWSFHMQEATWIPVDCFTGKNVFHVCSEQQVTDTPHHLFMYIHPLCLKEVHLHHLHSRWYIILPLCWKGIKTTHPMFTFLCKVQIQYRLVNWAKWLLFDHLRLNMNLQQ
jgi:hypothetical protein